MVIQGNVHLFGDNINTDLIIPARYCNCKSVSQLKEGCMHDLIDDFYKKVKAGDVIVAGKNFGCGSSREAAPLAIIAVGIECVIAESFSRIFYRNAINMGLKLISASNLRKELNDGEEIEVLIKASEISVNGKRIANGINEKGVIQDIIIAGGLVNYINKEISGNLL